MTKPITILITGAPGFIGSHFVEAVLKTTDWTIVGLDRIDATSTLQRVLELDAYRANYERFRFVWHDLRAPINDQVKRQIGEIDHVVHLAAGTHVDRSIADPSAFVLDNVLGTCHLLEWARTANLRSFVHYSTDEVYGSAPPGVNYREDQPFRSGNPYAATKAGAVELGQSYANTFGVPVITTFSMNVFGERQAVEKLIPLVIRKILRGETIAVHADSTRTKPARRGYLHARNAWNAVRFLIDHGVPGDRYHIPCDVELDVVEVIERVGRILDRAPLYTLVDFHSSRPGHDLRYGLDGSKLTSMGFAQPVNFEDSFERTVRWFASHPEWLT